MSRHADHREQPIRFRSNGPVVGQLRHAANDGGPKIFAVPVWRADVGLAALFASGVLFATAFVVSPRFGWGFHGRIAIQVLGTLSLIFAGQALIANLMLKLGILRQFELIYITQRLERNECGACGFSLDGLSGSPDGCRRCPECGAAWRTGSHLDDTGAHRAG